MEKTGVIVGLDVGVVRTGIARSDAMQMMAFPYAVISAKTESEMAAKVTVAIREIDPVLVVTGLPLDQYGTSGLQAGRVQSFVEKLRATLNIPFEYQDERFSTSEATRVAQALGVGSKKQRGKTDQVAAAIILQSWLDRRASQKNIIA